MISYVRTPVGLKPTWKGNLLLLLVEMLVSFSITLCFHIEMTAHTHDRAVAAAKFRAVSTMMSIR
jgi:hypothetical protein